MVETSFNLFDACVVGIILLSTLLSFFRGFVREVLSLGAWVGAAFITLLYAPDAAALIKDDIDHGPAALLVASFTLFFAAKILFSLVNMLLMRLFKSGKDIGVLDNILGLFFGVLRAALLISLAYYVYSFVASEDNQPAWIATSETRPLVARGADLLEPFLEDFIEDITPLLEDRAESAQPGSSETIRNLLNGAQTPGASGETGYDWMDAEDVQRLLEQSEQMRESQRNREEIRRLIEQQPKNLPQNLPQPEPEGQSR